MTIQQEKPVFHHLCADKHCGLAFETRDKEATCPRCKKKAKVRGITLTPPEKITA